MTCENPFFLWLLPLVALVWFVPHRCRDRRHGVLRSAVLVALLLGLARPQLFTRTWRDHHVVVLDHSPSVGAERLRAVLPAVADALPDGGVRVLVELVDSRAPDASAQAAGFDQVVRVDGDGGSPLGLLLQHALRAIPMGASGAITLVSDGLATDERWQRSLQELTGRGLRLHCVAVPPEAADVRVVDVEPIDELRVGHAARVRVAVAGRGDVEVRLFADGDEVARSEPFQSAGRQPCTLAFEPDHAGVVALAAQVVRTAGPDPRPANDRLERRFAVQDPLRVLYLGGRVQNGARHLGQLLGNGFAVAEPVGDDPAQLRRVDLTVLDDRPAAQLPERWQAAIATEVQARGMGLLLSGGRSAFGPGGYHDTVIEKLSPVEFVQKEEKKDPSTTLAVVIDTSGSMVGNRMTLAKEVARLAIRRLQPHDKVGIVEFYGTKQWAAPIQSAANSIDLQRALNRLGASGGTVLFPAIEECYYALKNVQTRYKHVLVITDAGVETGPYEALLRKMADEGIATSTVLVGPGRHSEFLVELADWGGGRYYHAPDRFNLPELLLKKPSTSMLPPYRPGRFEVEAHGGRGWWGDIDRNAIPPIETLVETAPRPGCDVLLAVKGSGRPVLASWRYGLGRVTAFCTEPVGPGTRGYRQWPGYAPWLARVASRTARSAEPPYAFRLERENDRLVVEARCEVAGVAAPAVSCGDGTLALTEIAPGVFRGACSGQPGEDVILRATGANGFTRLLCSDAFQARWPELQVDPRRALPMAAVAAATGGVHVAAGDPIPPLAAARVGEPLQLWPLWPWLVLLSLLAYLLDILHRRRSV